MKVRWSEGIGVGVNTLMSRSLQTQNATKMKQQQLPSFYPIKKGRLFGFSYTIRIDPLLFSHLYLNEIYFVLSLLIKSSFGLFFFFF